MKAGEKGENPGGNATYLHTKLSGMWREHTQEPEFLRLPEKYAEISRLLGRYAELNHHTISIYSTRDQEVYYMSENYLGMTGYSCSEKEYKRRATFYWMRDLPISQSWFFLQMTLFFRKIVKPKLREASPDARFTFYLHNLKLKPPGSHLHHFSITGDSLEIQSDGSVLIMLTIKRDVSALIKPEGYWWAEYHINNDTRFCFHENDRKFQKGGILSPREHQILLMIREGLSSKQISEKLCLSQHTVDKHRKNMLERTGLRDISGLIQVGEAGGIL